MGNERKENKEGGREDTGTQKTKGRMGIITRTGGIITVSPICSCTQYRNDGCLHVAHKRKVQLTMTILAHDKRS